MKKRFPGLLAAITLAATPALAMSDGDLRAAVEQRFKGDRTRACVAAAVIDNATTAKAYVCADAKSQRPLDDYRRSRSARSASRLPLRCSPS